MQLIEHYIRLFTVFSQCRPFQLVKLTRNEISKELHCTERTVTNLLNKMADENWIERKKGEGRGNITTIIFLKTIEEMFSMYEGYSPKYSDIARLSSILEEYDLLNEQGQILSEFILKFFGLKINPSSVDNEDEDEYEHLKIPYFRSFHSLDPCVVERQTERHMVQQIFNTLVIYNEEERKISPCIAHYWERGNDGKVWTFYLRKGIVFHNNKKLTSKDIKYSFERIRNTPLKWAIRHLEAINCIGNYVIQFEFSQPMYSWDIILTSVKCSIVPENYGDKSEEEFAKYPIGTGPFSIKEHNENLLNLVVHPNHFQGRANIDEISLYVLPSFEKYFNESKMENEPLFYKPFSMDKEDNNEYHYVQRNNLSIKYLMWNMNKRNIKRNNILRKKVFEMINKEKMVKHLGYPRFQKADSFIEPKNAYEPYNMINKETKYDKSLTLMTYKLTPNEDDLTWIKAEFAKHGIKLETILVPYSSFIEKSKEADLVLSEFVSEQSKEVSLYNLFLSESSVVSTLYNPEEFSYQYFDNATREKQQEERFQLLKQLEWYLINQDIILPLYSTFQKALFHRNLMGISLSTIGLVPFERLFFRKS